MDLYSYNNIQPENYIREQGEKNNIKLISKAAGLAVIGYIIIQNVLSTILFITPLGNLYFTNAEVQSVITIFLSVFSLLIPFGLCGFYLEKKTGADVFKFGEPVNTKLMLTSVPLGFFVCLVANYITSAYVTFFDSAGVELTAPEYNVPSDLPGRIVYAVSIAVVPALVEEFAIRGAVLQPLRKYGDKFAILASAIVFAALHGNLIQAPFALIAGVVLGYTVCITNSIWTGVLIHFCNNLYAVVTEFMIADIADETMFNTAYTAVLIALYVVSIIGSVLFVVVRNKRRIMPSFTVLSEGKKIKHFMLTLPMVIAIIIMIYITSQFVNL